MWFFFLGGIRGNKKMFPLKKNNKSYKMITAIKREKYIFFYIGIEKKFPLFPPSRINHIE